MATEAAGGQLAARIRTGDRDAIEDVIRTYLPQLLRAARGAGLTAQAAEDVTQDTFTTFVESAHRFEGRSHVRTWLFGILYHKIAETRRDLAREQRNDPIDQVFESRFKADGSWSQPPLRPDLDLQSKETMQSLRSCLEEAPGPQRMAFVLREVEGLSTAEICKILEVTATNLGVMLHRLRNRLRECLEMKGVR